MRPMLRCALLALLAPWISLTAAAAAAVEPSSVLYTVFPAPVRTERHLDRVEAIMDTWGAGQSVVVVSGESGQQQPVHGAPVWHVPDVTGKISEASMRIYLQRAMQEKWDWLMRVDDMAVVLPPNLLKLLEVYNASRPVLLGSKLVLPGTSNVYFTGGPGWVISRSAVQLFLDNWCPPSGSWYRDTVFDIQMHACLANQLGAQVESPRDEVNGVGAKFNTYGPIRSFHGPYDNWFQNYKRAANEHIFNGAACCARYPVSFYYIEAGEIRSIYSLLMEPRKWQRMSAQQKLDMLGSDVSPYSGKPTGPDDPVLDFLTNDLRVYGVYGH
eukprot:jgi/Tetstr1/434081/TSEL_023225.t1